jgi:hypothetical protein
MFRKLIFLLAVTSFFVGCHLSAASPSGELAKATARVKINQPVGNKVPIPLGQKLTIVNVFDEFSTGCPTGNRFETMERLNPLRPTGTAMLLIFSEKHFSVQDMDNFKAILPMADSLVQGDIEAMTPHLTNGKLLVVLDSNGSVIWHEKPDMAEQQVFDEISKLIQTTNK